MYNCIKMRQYAICISCIWNFFKMCFRNSILGINNKRLTFVGTNYETLHRLILSSKESQFLTIYRPVDSWNHEEPIPKYIYAIMHLSCFFLAKCAPVQKQSDVHGIQWSPKWTQFCAIWVANRVLQRRNVRTTNVTTEFASGLGHG